MARRPMSMEAMLDEERREVLALLEGPKAASRVHVSSSHGARSPSPYTSPQSPVRSMLDIGDDSPPATCRSSSAARQTPPSGVPRSLLDIGSPPPQVRSMLDVESPPPSAVKQTLSAGNSPTDTHYRAHSRNSSTHQRSMSDAATRPADFGPRGGPPRDNTSQYQFSDILTQNTGQALPKRVLGGGRKRGNQSMAAVMSRTEVVLPGDRGRHHSIAGFPRRLGDKSKSPHSRLGMGSNSPHNNLLSGRHLSPAGRVVPDDGQTIDMSNAYRRLSDAALLRSGGSLSELGARRKRSDDVTGMGRLEKDYLSPDGDLLPEDSSDDQGGSSEDERERGRKTARSFEQPGPEGPSGAKGRKTATGKAVRQTLSLLAAAEEERIQVAARSPAQYRSLLDDPQITVTNPSGEKVKQSKPGVHPATSFDTSQSGSRTPIDSDAEQDYTDIKRAQKMAFSMTHVMSASDSHRAIRIINRGEVARIQQEAEDEHRRLRKYLVATDLSEESTHALEWTVGTVLRDGDTLIALCCVDEETGIVTGDAALVPDDPRAMKEQAAAITAVTASKQLHMPASGGATPIHKLPSAPGALGGRTAGGLASGSASPGPAGSRERSKAEEERYRAVQDITDRVTKLLRKTKLQVRVIVEVLHCKNPKHLITEVIDVLNPTLVILGSRGRSALKGVILGSFSNYLVTKSSVPVMVARKRLRKQSKYNRPPIRQVNNIGNPTARSLANAKID